MSGTDPFPLSTGAAPLWVAGYVVPADEWNMWWSRKIDTNDPQLLGGPFLALSGGTMVGPLTLAGPPLQPLQAATKAYVDAITPAAGPFLPFSGGTMTGTITMPSTYVPVNTEDVAPKGYVDSVQSAANAAASTANQALTTANAALPRTGGVMTGYLTLVGDPPSALVAATKQYVDNHFLSLAGGTISGPLWVVGQGISFRSYSAHTIAFGWDGSFPQAWVDGSYIGELATTGWVNANFPTYGWVQGNYYSAGTSDARYLYKTGDNCTGGLTVNGGVYSASDITAAGNLHAGNALNADGAIWAYASSSAGFGLWVDGGNNRHFQWAQGSWDFQWEAATGNVDYWRYDGVAIHNWAASGDYWIQGHGYSPAGGAWIATSDARLKTVLGDYTSSLATLIKLHPRRYKFTGEYAQKRGLDGEERIGLVADEVEQVMPELVRYAPEHAPVLRDLPPDTKFLDISPMFYAFLNALREISVRLGALEGHIQPGMTA